MSGIYLALSVLHGPLWLFQGRRAALRAALAPGYYIPRLWRWAYCAPLALGILRAFGAGHIVRLWRWAYCAPLALGILRAFGAGRGLNSDFSGKATYASSVAFLKYVE